MHHPTTLKIARVQQDLTQVELATILGVSVSAVTSWETNRRHIDPQRKPEVERVLGLPTGTLGTRSRRRGPARIKTTTPATTGDRGRKDHANRQSTSGSY